LLNPGGGGHEIDGQPAAKVFEVCAQCLSTSCDHSLVLVYGPNYSGKPLEIQGVKAIGKMSPESFQAAIMGASGFLSGGGGALFQAVDAKLPTVGVALSPDQKFRIGRMYRRNLIGRAKPVPVEMEEKINSILEYPPAGLSRRSGEEDHALDRIENRVKELLNFSP
ncbi:MAG: hypothetical protein P8X57_11265, partial [Cyclobacteriaceae bacterium]